MSFDNQHFLTQLAEKNEIRQLRVDHIQIPLKNLAPSLEGFSIALLGDFHLYPFTDLDLVNQAVAMSNALKPDLTVMVGDYVWRKVDAIHDLVPALGKLKASHGVYSVLGNHDLWTDVTVVKDAFKAAKLPLLINQGLSLSVGSAHLYLAGLDDGWAGEPDLEAALSSHTAGEPVILLVHEPDLAENYALDGRISLQLSGHSHGGQVRLPKIGPMVLPHLGRKYDMGLYQVKDMWLYTTRGIGVTNLPVRYNCPPEIAHLTLIRA